VTERLARSCSRHPWRTLSAWVVVVVLSLVAAATLLSGLTTNASVTNNPESDQANRIRFAHFPFDPTTAVSDVIVIRSDRWTVDQPAFKSFVSDLEAKGQALGTIQQAHVYLTEPDPSLVSADRHATRIALLVADDDAVKPVVDLVQSTHSPDFQVAITGEHVADNDFNNISQHDLESGELKIGLPAALIVLLLVFGSVVASLVPLMMSFLSIAVGIGIVALVSQEFELSIFIVNMLTGMGLALGVDYSLFIVSRYREERGRGRSQEEAIAMAGATASRAVLFSGSAFVIALFGMLLVPTTIMRSLAAGAIIVGIVSVVAALTLLPALLGLIGDRVNALRLPFVGAKSIEESHAESRTWRRIVETVLRRPALSAVIAAGLMLAAAVPVLGLHVGQSGVSTLPDRVPSKQGFLLQQQAFPGVDSVDPVRIVTDRIQAPGVRPAFDKLSDQLANDPRFGRGGLQLSQDGKAAMLVVPVGGDPVGAAATSAVRDLRANLVPRAFAGTGVKPLVTGQTAENVDYYDASSKPAPYVIAFVLGLTLILLTIVFRSIVIAMTAIVLNLLSVGAACGLLVLVSLHGIGAGLLGFEQVDALDAWVPLFLFSVLFGLSMDYQVFLLSRIRERYDHTRDTTDAVTYGVASTARIITGAALIIVAVFSGFAAGDLVMFQQMGFGIAVALLLDATIIRSVLLPSVMKLLGQRNWYLPRWLNWLPQMNVEGPAGTEPRVVPAGRG
jgi:putative drug exporter of the RND superfamily